MPWCARPCAARSPGTRQLGRRAHLPAPCRGPDSHHVLSRPDPRCPGPHGRGFATTSSQDGRHHHEAHEELHRGPVGSRLIVPAHPGVVFYCTGRGTHDPFILGDIGVFGTVEWTPAPRPAPAFE